MCSRWHAAISPAQAYHDFIGFEVAKELVGRAFYDTYRLELADLFSDFNLAVSSYRSAVSRTIPLATRVAWAQKKDEIKVAQPGITRRRFVYIMKRSSYEREWGKRLEEPNWIEKFLALLLKVIPPIGPLQTLNFEDPNPSGGTAVYGEFHQCDGRNMRRELERGEPQKPVLPNKNYDVGVATPAGVYRLNDDTQAFWLHKLAEKKFASITPAIKQELLSFYSDPNAPFHTKQKPKEWRQTLAEVAELKGHAPAVTSETLPGSGGSFYRLSQEPCRPISLVQ